MIVTAHDDTAAVRHSGMSIICIEFEYTPAVDTSRPLRVYAVDIWLRVLLL